MDIELMEKRTQTSKTFVDENGLHTLHSYMAPIHYLDENKQWADIDLTIEPISVWEFRNAVLKNTYRAYFYDEIDTNNHLVSMEVIKNNGTQRWVNFKLKSSLNALPLVSDNNFVFKNCFDGVDVEYIVTEERFKENIILNKKVDITDFVFTLKLGGVQVSNDDQGNVVFRDVDDGTIIMSIDKPFMLDANGNKSDGVRYVVGNDEGWDTIAVIVDDVAFLDSATYPVVIDPTLTVTTWSSNFNTYSRGIFADGYFYVSSSTSDAAFQATDLDPYRDKTKYIVSKAIYSLYAQDVFANVNYYKIESAWGNPVAPTKSKTKIPTPNTVEVVNNWIDFDVTKFFDSSFNGIFIERSNNAIASFISPAHSDTTKRPKVSIQYYFCPALSFVDADGSLYSEPSGNLLKYLDLGAMTAGQTSLPAVAYLRNDTGRPIKNLRITLENTQVAQSVTVELSQSNNPFIGSDSIYYNGIIDPDSIIQFYVRVSTDTSATQGGNITIRASADML